MKKTRKITTIVSVVILLVVSLALTLTSCAPKVYKLNFDVDGAVVKTIDVPSVGTPELPDTPVKAGYTFEGWYFDKDTWSDPCTEKTIKNKKFAADTAAYAKWTAVVYTIKYVTNCATVIADTTYDMLTMPSALATLSRDGYTFDGWYDNADAEGKVVTAITKDNIGNKILVAKWTKNDYTITYDLDGGINGKNPTGYAIDTATITLSEPTKVGYTFGGWYGEETFATKVTEIAKGSTGDKTLFAKWNIVNYEIKYTGVGGASNINPINYNVASGVVKIVAPTKVGYTFTGWSGTDLDGVANMTFTILAKSTGIREYVAHWTKDSYTLTYVVNGGTSILTPTITYDIDSIPTLEQTTREHYEFDAWYTTATFEKGTSIAAINETNIGAMTLYARWTAVKYTISYETNLGSAVAPATYTIETLPTLATTKRDGYNFEGWYTNANFAANTEIIEINVKHIGTMTLYAKWIQYTVGLHYELVRNAYEVSCGNITGGDVVIASEYNGLSVAVIADNAFYNTTTGQGVPITSIVIPDSVSVIGINAFKSCTALKSVVMSNNVTGIRRGAFESCVALKSVNIPNSVTFIEGGAFNFANVDITIYCECLENNKPGVWDHNWHEDVPSNQIKWGQMLSADGLIYAQDGETGYAVVGCVNVSGDLVIPNTFKNKPVTKIAADAFYNTAAFQGAAITSVVIPDSVTEIGAKAFRECIVLRSANIPSSVTVMGDGVFSGCDTLASVNIGNGMTSIAAKTFFGCSALANVNIPSSVLSIGDDAFSGCASLANVDIPNSVNSIGLFAFQNCMSLKKIFISSSVTTMGSGVFNGCNNVVISCQRAESPLPQTWDARWMGDVLDTNILWGQTRPAVTP